MCNARNSLRVASMWLACTWATWTPRWSAIPADQKIDPTMVATLALDGLFAGEPEILADDMSRTVKAQLSDSHREP
jgi:hypothetical protein